MISNALKHILIAVAIVALSNTTTAQSDNIDKGDQAFADRDFMLAIDFYESARELSPVDPSITRKLGLCYERLGQRAVAAEWYKRTIDIGAGDTQDLLLYAEALKGLEQYDEAVMWFERFAKKRPKDKRAASHLHDKEYYLDLLADTAQYKVRPLKINNASSVVSISPFTNGIYFMSGINVANDIVQEQKSDFLKYLDVYSVKWNGTELTDPTNIGGMANSPFHDGPAFFSPTDNTLYITRNNPKLAVKKDAREEDLNLMIVASKWDAGKWGEPMPLMFNSNEYSNGHVALSPDGHFLYFVSDRPGGFGGTDLYVATRSGDQWINIANLGPEVNTEGNEMFPFVDANGKLYFSSNGHAGLGGMDLFVTGKETGTWSRPLNLGAPINSPFDDFSIMYNVLVDEGFFFSNRNGLGNDDVFYFTHKSFKEMLVSVKIVGKNRMADLTDQPINVVKVSTGEIVTSKLSARQSIVLMLEAGEEVAVYMTNDKYFDTTVPVFTFKAPERLSDPFIALGEKTVVTKRDPEPIRKATQNENSYQKVKSAIDETLESVSSARKPVKLAVDLEAQGIGNVFFGYNSIDLNNAERVKLDRVYVLMNDKNDTRLVIRAYCDSRGSAEYNRKLSMDRAMQVKTYLEGKGITSDRLRIEWYGKDNPAVECVGKKCSEDIFKMNRRAELNLITMTP